MLICPVKGYYGFSFFVAPRMWTLNGCENLHLIVVLVSERCSFGHICGAIKCSLSLRK